MIKKSTAFLVDYFFHTGIVASFLYINCQIIRGFKFEFYICALIFFTTLAIYNYSNLTDSYLKGRKIILLFSLLFILILGIVNVELLLEYWYKILAVFVLVLLYIFPENKLRLRNTGTFKIFILSIAWALTGVIPNEFSNPITQYTFLMNFFFIFSLSIPFDIRDMKIDKLRTIPKIIGISKSIILSIVSFCISLFIQFFLTQSLAITILMLLVGIPILLFARTFYRNKFYLAIIELLILLNGILLLV